MKKFTNKIKKIIKKLRKNKLKRNLEKEKKLLNQIQTEYPLLTARPVGEKHVPRESIMDYYTIKSIKSQKRNNFLIPLLTIVIIILTILQINLQIKNSLSPTPEINLERVDGNSNKFFSNWDLVQLSHNENWTFNLNFFDITFVVRNDGRGNAGNVHLYVKDQEETFRTASLSKEVAPFDFEYFNLQIRHKDCFGGEGKEEYYERRALGCNSSNVDIGLKEFILIKDCSSCNIKNQLECYSFNICVYNQTLKEEWCQENFREKDFDLKKVNCPRRVY